MRAAVIDKGSKPKVMVYGFSSLPNIETETRVSPNYGHPRPCQWNPPSLGDVKSEALDLLFLPFPEEQELHLPSDERLPRLVVRTPTGLGSPLSRPLI